MNKKEDIESERLEIEEKDNLAAAISNEEILHQSTSDMASDDEAMYNNYTRDEEVAEHTRPSLKEVIEENAREDEKPFSSSLTLRTILGGDILNTQAIRRQVWLILLITFFSILYVSNRYSCQKQQIRIDNLNDELKKSKYKTLSLSSVLTERSRESHVEELLKANSDSTIHAADQPPYIVVVPQSPVK